MAKQSWSDILRGDWDRPYGYDKVNWLFDPKSKSTTRSEPMKNLLSIKKVIFNCPATIVYWSDNSKTVVKVHDELFDREKGLAMAISKKVFGNEGSYKSVFKKWIS